MARYTGPKVKVLRRFTDDTDLPGLTRKTKGEKKFLPGQHGPTLRRRVSDYSVRLSEKQKVMFNFGVSEKQLRKYFKKAHRSKHDTGAQLLVFLESRLDNVVFRAGFAPTIPAARQLVTHGHIYVNGQRVTKPSFQISAADEIVVKESSRNMPVVAETINEPSLTVPEYLAVDSKEFKATVKTLPQRDDVPLEIEDNLIVEFYARSA